MTQPGRPESPWDLYPEQDDDVSSTAWMTPDPQVLAAPRPAPAAPVVPVAPDEPPAQVPTTPGALWASPSLDAPPAEAASVAAIEGVPAETAPRVIAWLIDCLIVAVLSALAGILVSIFGFADTPIGALVMGIINTAISYRYFTRLWLSDRRATFGMRLMGLGVGRAADGAPLTERDAAIRWLAFGGPIGGMNGVPGLAVFAGLGILIWYPALVYFTESDASHRGPHDHAAGSLVVARPGGFTLGW